MKYVLNRVLMGVLTLFVLATICFFLVRAIPGGPFDGEVALPASVVKNIEVKYGVNEPILGQYFIYMKRIVRGDLGESFKYENQTVSSLIARGFPVTARLGLAAIVIALSFGIVLGVVSSLKHRGIIDMITLTISMVGICLPSFVIAILLMYFFGLKLGWFPFMGIDTLRHYILPSIALSLYPIAYVSRLTRASMLEVLGQDYIITARSKGISKFKIVFIHALKNALLPVVTYIGPLIAYLLTGSFVIEKMFSIPGIGKMFVTGIGNRDYSVVLGMTIFFGALLVLLGIVVDLAYMFIDPRVKFEKRDN